MSWFSRLFESNEAAAKRVRSDERERALDQWQALDRRVDRQAFSQSSPAEIRRLAELTRKYHESM